MREFIRLFLFGVAWFFVPVLIAVLGAMLFLAYLGEAVVVMAMLVTGLLYLISGDPGMREPFFYFLLIAIFGFAFSVAVLGKAWQALRSLQSSRQLSVQ